MNSIDTIREVVNPTLEEVLAAYLDELDSGRTVNECDWIEQFPSFGSELEAFFQSQRVVQSAIDQSSLHAASASEGKRTPFTSDDNPPDRVSDYELIREIGRGGMGIVYEAHQPGLSRSVALKMLRNAGSASAEELGRLRNEAESIARLNHPAIVAVHDIGSDEGQFWFTMQLIRGKNLTHFADRFRNEPREAVRIVKRISQAIEHAHRRGVLHRDLKPGNVLLDEEGKPHVTDFGLARRTDFDGSLTQTGTILGTPAYLAPEQLVDPRSATTAADVYGLGAILYFLLAGRPPVVADSIVEAIDNIRNQPIEPPSRSNPHVPKDLDAVCLRCLEKRPEDRYDSAGDLAQDLGRILEGRPIEARTIATWEHVDRWRKRNPGLAWLTASVIALSLLLLIGSTVTAVLLARAGRQTQESLNQTVAAKQELEGEKRAALRNLYEARKQQALAAQFSGRPGQRIDAMNAVQDAAALIPPLKLPNSERLSLRNLQIAAMQLVDLVEDQPRELGIVSPDGRLHAKPNEDLTALEITDLKSRQPLTRLVVEGPGKIDWDRQMHVWFSPNGRYLGARVLSGEAGVVQIWKCDRPEPILISDQSTSRETADYSFSRDGNLVGFVVDGQLRVHHLPNGNMLLDVETPEKVGLSFAHLGNQIAAYGGGKIAILDLSTGETIRELDTVEGVNLAEWTPDDCMLLGRLDKHGSRRNELHLWDSVTGERRELAGHVSTIEFFDIHPRGDFVATSSWDGSVRLWSLRNFDQVLQLDGYLYRFSREGRRLGVRTKDGAGQWRVELPHEYCELIAARVLDPLDKPITGELQGVAVHPDGRLMVGGNFDALSCWDLATGQTLAGAPTSGADAHFSPDGSRLFTFGRNLGEVYVQAVEREELEENAIYKISPPRRLEVAADADESYQPVSFVDSNDDHYQSTPLPAFGIRSRTEDSWGEFFVIDMDRSLLIPVRGKRRQLNHPAVSADGELLAVGNWLGPDTNVWDVRGGKLLKTIASDQSNVAFGPDGRMLAVNEPGRCTVYEVGTWKRLFQSASEVSHTVARAVAFSPDGSMLAFDPGSRRDIRLLSTRDFQEIATVHLPSSRELVDRIDFSPDGSKLIESSGNVVQVWDLRLIRERLGDLDWNLPSFPPSHDAPSKSVRVQFVSDTSEPSTP